PGELHDAPAYPADSLGEELPRNSAFGGYFRRAKLVSTEYRHAVLTARLPDGLPFGDEPLGEAPPRMGQRPNHLHPEEPHPAIISLAAAAQGLNQGREYLVEVADDRVVGAGHHRGGR